MIPIATPSFDCFDKAQELAAAELREYVSTDASFHTAYLRAVASIAASDGVPNIADFTALETIFELFNGSALAQVVVLESLGKPTPWRDAFQQLKATSVGLSADVSRSGFEAAKSVLQLQGLRSRDLADAFADALGVSLAPVERMEFSADESGLWNKVSLGSVRMIKGRQFADLADLCIQATGDLSLVRAVLECESGGLAPAELAQMTHAAAAAADIRLTEFDARISDFEEHKALAGSLVDSVSRLQSQVRQRLAIVDARIAYERQTFAEDLEECIHDAGNAFTRDVVERLDTDAWKRLTVWESIARSTFGKELERRLNRTMTRREESLNLIRQDLNLFREELVLSRTMIWKRMHHTQLSAAAPSLRWGTRIKNGVETAANTTLWVGGGLGVAGAGAAYFLGAAAILPVIAPAVPVVGGVVILAGAVKWLMNPSDRKREEIEHQRSHFEKAFRMQLEQAQSEINQQLDLIEREFHVAAEQLVRPIVLEAQAAERLTALKVKVARRLAEHTRKALAQMRASAPITDRTSG